MFLSSFFFILLCIFYFIELLNDNIFFIILFIIIYLSFTAKILISNFKNFLLNPFFLVNTSFFIHFIVPYIYSESFLINNYDNQVKSLVNLTILLSFTFLNFFNSNKIFFKKYKKSFFNYFNNRILLKRNIYLLLSFYIFAFIYFGMFSRNFMALQQVKINSNLILSILPILYVGAYLIPILIYFKKKFNFILLITIQIIFCYVYLISGSKYAIVSILYSYFGYYYVYVNKNFKFSYFVIFFLFFLLLMLVNILRNDYLYNLFINFYFSELFTETELLLNTTFLSVFTQIKNLYFGISLIPSKFDFYNGQIIFEQLFYEPFPRSIFVNKPIFYGTNLFFYEFTNQFSNTDILSFEAISFPLFFYLDFGVLGVVFGSIFTSLLIKLYFDVLFLNRENIFCFYIFLNSFVIYILISRGFPFTPIQVITSTIFPIIFSIFFSKKIVNNYN